MSSGWNESREGLQAGLLWNAKLSKEHQVMLKFSVEKSQSSVTYCHKEVRGPFHHCGRYSSHSPGTLQGWWRRALSMHGSNTDGLQHGTTNLDLAASSFWLSEAGGFHPAEVTLISILPSFKEQFPMLLSMGVFLFTSLLWCFVMLTPTTCSYAEVETKLLPLNNKYSRV